MGVSDHVIEVVMSLYQSPSFVVRGSQQVSKYLPLTRGSNKDALFPHICSVWCSPISSMTLNLNTKILSVCYRVLSIPVSTLGFRVRG